MSTSEAKNLKALRFDTVNSASLQLENRHNTGHITFSKTYLDEGFVDVKVTNNYGLIIEIHRMEIDELISVLESMKL